MTTVLGLAGFLWVEMRGMRVEFKAEMQASEARQNKRIDEVKDDLKEIRADIKTLLLALGAQRSAAANA